MVHKVALLRYMSPENNEELGRQSSTPLCLSFLSSGFVSGQSVETVGDINESKVQCSVQNCSSNPLEQKTQTPW